MSTGEEIKEDIKSGWVSRSLGISPARKEEIYLELSKSATLLDAAYWLQIIFSAGIATLGLALNSPAVIIGAMLISPLMGPILSAGLALAAGDVILGMRSLINLGLSCLLAIVFAMALVGILPFKEMTGEIAARTQPNTLDLAVALFSGAIGSLAICREVRGVVTSIPGVAIAVALMPPLCVVGYGAGIALTVEASQGFRVARGGGLLFLTNLVAITFTSMLVFLLLRIDTEQARRRIRAWRRIDPEVVRIRSLLARFRLSDRVKVIGGLPGRFVVIVIPILILLIPLSQSLSQLKLEIGEKQRQNRIKQTTTELWQQYFARMPGGQQRSFIDQLSVSEAEGKLSLAMRVITSQPYTPAERQECLRLISSNLGLNPDAMQLELIEIPTTAAQLAAKTREESRPISPPTVQEAGASFLRAVGSAMRGLRFPPSATLLNHSVTTGSTGSLRLSIVYLSDRDMDPDARSMIVEDIRARFNDPDANLDFTRVPVTFGPLAFRRNQSTPSVADLRVVEEVVTYLQTYQELTVEVTATSDEVEDEQIREDRYESVNRLLTELGIEPTRIERLPNEDQSRSVLLRLRGLAS